MSKVTIGLVIGLGTVVMAAGPARADKPGAEKPAAMDRLSKPVTATGTAMAKDGKPAGEGTAAPKTTKPGKMMCEEFLSLDEVMRPKVVYWAEGFNKKGKPEDAVFDVESTDRMVPTLVEVCQQEPKASFMKKVKAEAKKTP
ncbi:MAG TPA: HdeA/HdeB family chaperone [Polyangia bacterium]|jgi:hypothetical protein